MKVVRKSSEEEIHGLLMRYMEYMPRLQKKIDSIDGYVRKLFHNAEVIELIDKSESLGTIIYYNNNLNNNGIGYISLIIVSPKYQHSGFGRLLLEVCNIRMKLRGIERIRLEVDSENEIAKRFYQKNGFGYICVGKTGLVMERIVV